MALAAKERFDRMEFLEDAQGYFRDRPISRFLEWDRGLVERNPGYFASLDTSDTGLVIVKASTNVITHDDSRRTVYTMNCISEEIKQLRETYGKKVMVVSSGVLGLGRKARLSMGERIPESEKDSIEQKIEDARIGQPIWYMLWEHHMYPYRTEKSLVVNDDLRDFQKADSLFRKWSKWLEIGIIPIVNEDDLKSQEEIITKIQGQKIFSDNDVLSGLIAKHLTEYLPKQSKILLAMLTNTNGIYTAESIRTGKYETIAWVKDSKGLESQAILEKSNRGRGGRLSTIQAARDATSAGNIVVVANGMYANHDADYQKGAAGAIRRYNILDAIMKGKFVGTTFLPYY